ncbi:CBS domain-containing protein [Paenibacillus melissococcoides]|uniref:CBS domain-containing protein n=1 Tax=Paenibacillus melissococcoides TaxID=2912268 RepID=A0ABM9G588_9BACL|nr:MULTISPECIES: CBS domain-containing protein [Paenibacillus]MEB9894158.1 CBS domain-containing protein [Bacillus cereus]CAH8246957.1 CBS domain-containing protein [Paenibacillus melissococcoides]CAH8716315.1 CBS domain-containing protein [Paenibacillus melissococcoides]CAH8717297.1 CBS domain-containing protein [Paenibacillus melissococcoides]
MNEHRAAAREYDDLVHDAPAIDPQTPIEEVERIFLSDSSLRCLIVVDGTRQPTGMVMRERFHEGMYDSLILTHGGQYAGVLSAKQLSELSSRVRRNADRKLAM